MKLGKIVGAVLLTSLLSYSAITLFYTQSPVALGVIFFIISASLTTLAVGKGWKMKTKDLIFIALELIILCATFSFLLGSLKAYQVEKKNDGLRLQNIRYDIEKISSKNDYYSQYIAYVSSELSDYNSQNSVLYADIEKERSRPPEVVIVEREVPYTPPEVPVVTQVPDGPEYEDDDYRYYYGDDYEYEEEDDD